MTVDVAAIIDRHLERPIVNTIVQMTGPDLDISVARGCVAVEDEAPVQPHFAFRSASIAKTVTAGTVVRMAEEDRLKLDDRVIDHVDVGSVLSAIPAGTSITVRQALNHTAGLYDYAKDDDFALLLAADPQRTWTPIELLEQSLSLGQPYFEPGGGCHYSDANYVLAGMVAEAVGAEPLDALQRRYLFEPLGMDHTWMEGVEVPRAAVAHAHVDEFDAMALDSSFEWAAGGLMTTASDLTRLVRGVVEGGLFNELGDDVLEMVPLDPGHHEEMRSYGLGVMTCELAGELLLGHTGYWGTFMFLWPARQMTICGTVNQPGGHGVKLVQVLVEAFTSS